MALLKAIAHGTFVIVFYYFIARLMGNQPTIGGMALTLAFVALVEIYRSRSEGQAA